MVAQYADVVAQYADVVAQYVDVVAQCEYVVAQCEYVVAQCVDVVAQYVDIVAQWGCGDSQWGMQWLSSEKLKLAYSLRTWLLSMGCDGWIAQFELPLMYRFAVVSILQYRDLLYT
jgi:hypothetical protein